MIEAESKTSSIHARVNDRVRSDAEGILNSMGISLSQFINMALYQVIIKHRIPFELDAPEVFPKSLYDSLDEAERNRSTTKYTSANESYLSVKSRLKEKYNV